MEWLWDLVGKAWQLVSGNAETAAAALFGTFFGAWFAFLFERKHQEKLTRDASLAAGREAQFALISQLNTMKNVRAQYLEPKKGDDNRHLTLTPFQILAEHPKLPMHDLNYFLEDAEGANILGEVMVAQHRFFTFVAALDQRNMRHENMQRVIARVGPELGIDDATRGILKGMTDSLYGLADDILKHHDKSIKDIRGYLRKRFPGKSTLGLESA